MLPWTGTPSMKDWEAWFGAFMILSTLIGVWAAFFLVAGAIF